MSKSGHIRAVDDASRGGARIRSLWSFQGRYRTLHQTWFAFFLSFVVWFNFAPFAKVVGAQLGLSKAQLTTLALCNVALTVPARVLIGMLLDRLGPRRVYAGILIFSAIPCTIFAFASSFPLMVFSRLALSVVGAGFVVGIRMVSEWFPPKELGTAEGVYGGWGNFGSAAAAALVAHRCRGRRRSAGVALGHRIHGIHGRRVRLLLPQGGQRHARRTALRQITPGRCP